MNEHEQLLNALQQLAQQMGAQTSAINRLAASNEAIVMAMAEADDADESGIRAMGMDGKSLRIPIRS